MATGDECAEKSHAMTTTTDVIGTPQTAISSSAEQGRESHLKHENSGCNDEDCSSNNDEEEEEANQQPESTRSSEKVVDRPRQYAVLNTETSVAGTAESTAAAAAEPDDIERSETRATSSSVEYSIFAPGLKRYIVICASCAALFSPLSSQIYFPAMNTLAADLNVSIGLINLTMTSYMVCSYLPTYAGSGD